MFRIPLSKTLLALCAAGLLASCGTPQKPVTFAIASDFHAQDIPDGGDRLNAFIDTAISRQVDFIIELGDFCRLDSISKPYRDSWQRFPGDKYHVIGNHDMDVYGPDEYTAGMGMPGRYYSFDRGDYHFIVLDGNNIFDGEKYTHYDHANYYANPKFRAFIDPEQMEWLRQDLAATTKRCVLFSHQSLDQVVGNREEVRKILEEENERAGFTKVVAAFSGHNHSNYQKTINGITYIQINSASYVWVDQDSGTERRYPEEINKKYSLLKYSITYDRPLFGIVTLTDDGLTMEGVDGHFLPPMPQEVGLGDSLGPFPLVPWIRDVQIEY